MSTVVFCWTALLLASFTVNKMCRCADIMIPSQYTALSGDLEVKVVGVATPSRVQLLEQAPYEQATESTPYTVMGSAVVLGSTNGNTTMPMPNIRKAIFPCGVIVSGGRYGLRLLTQVVESPVSPYDYDVVTQGTTTTEVQTETDVPLEDDIVPLDVRWPDISLSLEPKTIPTYPEINVTARVVFHKTTCKPAIGTLVPETWLDLIYCGHSPVSCTNSTHKQLVFSEQIRGYPSLREITLKCDLFGLAGHYALALRPSMQPVGPTIAITTPDETVKVVWSDKFVFNVHARSIFPCDGHNGVSVLFQYPGCILNKGDRIRVFGRLRADVAALAPPSTLHYLAEQKVTRGQHALTFDCDLFTEKYIEYCFVYVSQAITGAVSDVRMDCVPTLPVLGKRYAFLFAS